MKVTGSVLALVATVLPLTANAFCTFRLKVTGSSNPDINGRYLQTLDNVVTIGPPFTNVTLTFGSGTGPSILQGTDVPGGGIGNLALSGGSLGLDRLVFVDQVPAGSRWLDWVIPNPADNILTYGTRASRFVVASPPSEVAHYEIYWIEEGVSFSGFPVNLVAECI